MKKVEKIKLRGVCDNWNNVEVYLNGDRLDPKRSQNIRNHSPDGFSWGYAGSGPAQLALAICLELYGDLAPHLYQDFKDRYIATLPQADFDREIVFEESWIKIVCE